MEFYKTDFFGRDVEYTELPKATRMAAPRDRYVTVQVTKLLGAVGAVALTGLLSVQVASGAVAGTATTAIVRDLSATNGSHIPTNPLPPAWSAKADRFRRLFAEIPETDFERNFDIDHDL
jgi:hypothetical protein